MEVKTKQLDYSMSQKIRRLYFIGDIHAGTKAHSESTLDRAIKTIIQDDDALMIGMGDYCELITPKDPRFDFDIISDWGDKSDIAKSQEDYIIQKFKPIAKQGKILGLIRGNHEKKYQQYNYGNVQQHICDALNVPNLGFSCFYDLSFGRCGRKDRRRYRLCLTHGSTGACTDSYKNTVLCRWIDQNQADIYAYAHVHDIKYKARQYLGVNQDGKIVNREAMGVMTGCFFRTYVQGIASTYGEEKNLSPVKLGYPIIEINIPEYALHFSEVVSLKQD